MGERLSHAESKHWVYKGRKNLVHYIIETKSKSVRMENIEWEEDEDVGRPDHVYKWAKLKNLGFILGSTDILKYFSGAKCLLLYLHFKVVVLRTDWQMTHMESERPSGTLLK